MVRVSIMIPTYNYGHFLGEAIQSVLDQTFQDFELIIVDDGSTDNTREIVNSFKDNRIRYIYQDHRGVTAAQNVALRAASGEYVTGLGADDVYLPQNLELKVRLLDSRPDIGLVCSDAYGFDDNTGAIIGKLWRDTNGPYPGFDPVKAVQQPSKELLRIGCYIALQASMIRRQVFDVVGYLDETLSTSEDWDFIFRIVQRFRIEIIDIPLVKCRRHRDNLTKNVEMMYWGEVAVCNKVMRSGSLSKDEITLLNKRMAPEHYWYVRLALLAGREAAARKALIAGIRLDPWNIKLYAYFALSILGNRQYLDLKKLMKKLRYHSAGRRTSRDERPSGNQQSENTDFSRPKVSVVIATYNYGRFLGEAIQSVLNQTFQDFEIIVADDGSTDNTREIVEKFSDPRIRYIYQDHIGVSAAENAGLRAARGEYITGIGADDLYLPQNLETKVKLLDSHPETGMVYSDCYFFDDITGAITGNLWRSAKGLHPWFDPERAARQPLKELLYRGCFIMPQASMMRRQVFATVGYFDESLPTYEDWDLIIRILQHFPAELIDIPLLKLRQHSTNLTGNKEKMYLGVAAAANKVIRSGSLSRDEFRYLRKRLVPQHLEYGRQALADGREAAARKALMACIRLNPRKIKPYVYLLMSLLGTKRYLALRSFKKVASHHSIQVRSSGGASCERDKLLSK